jgi:hypothetical protein
LSAVQARIARPGASPCALDPPNDQRDHRDG